MLKIYILENHYFMQNKYKMNCNSKVEKCRNVFVDNLHKMDYNEYTNNN